MSRRQNFEDFKAHNLFLHTNTENYVIFLDQDISGTGFWPFSFVSLLSRGMQAYEVPYTPYIRLKFRKMGERQVQNMKYLKISSKWNWLKKRQAKLLNNQGNWRKNKNSHQLINIIWPQKNWKWSWTDFKIEFQIFDQLAQKSIAEIYGHEMDWH